MLAIVVFVFQTRASVSAIHAANPDVSDRVGQCQTEEGIEEMEIAVVLPVDVH